MSSAPSRSSVAPDAELARALEGAAEAVLRAVRAVQAANPVVVIDGRSGAGKTTLAARVVERWPWDGRVQVIALDSLYPGWDGLDAGVDVATERVLLPHGRGLHSTWRRWDWSASREAESHAVDPSLPLVVEGAGILTPTTARLADVGVWVEAPAGPRRERALRRDGDAYRPHWERWATQEERHLRRDDPRALATLRIALP